MVVMLKRVEVKEKVILHTITIVVAYILRIDERTFKKTKKEKIFTAGNYCLVIKFKYFCKI